MEPDGVLSGVRQCCRLVHRALLGSIRTAWVCVAYYILGMHRHNQKMAAQKIERVLPDVPNFRAIEGTKLYRSSKPDRMKESDLEIAREKLGLKSIIDLRSKREIRKPVLANRYFMPFAASPVDSDNKSVIYEALFTDKREFSENELKDVGAKHFVLDLVSTDYVKNVLALTPFLLRMVLYFILMIDRIFKSSHFMKALVLTVINTKGLKGQYKDTIRHCGPQICTVLRVLAEPSNSPSMVCCAYGKDRTGIISAIIHLLMGKSKDFIAQDYSKSRDEILAIYTDLEAELKTYSLNNTFATAEYDTMVELLDFIEAKYGSIQEYLAACGFDSTEQDALIQAIQIKP